MASVAGDAESQGVLPSPVKMRIKIIKYLL
jgi:hypothetical protein